MPGPIENIGAKAITPASTDPAQKIGGGDSQKFEKLRKGGEAEKAAGAADLPPMKEVTPIEQKQIERDFRRRLEKTNSTDPGTLFSSDFRQLRKGVDQLKPKVEATVKANNASGAQGRLAEIEAQYNAIESKMQNMPDTNNLRDLLSMQTEMYKMSQNIELLTKVVDSATSGIKTTMQMQI